MGVPQRCPNVRMFVRNMFPSRDTTRGKQLQSLGEH